MTRRCDLRLLVFSSVVLGCLFPGVASAATGPSFTPFPASMTTQRSGAAAAPLLDGKVLIAGGINSNVAPDGLSSAELFDPSTDKFMATGSMTTTRVGAVAARLPDGDVLIAGGTSKQNSLSSAELYDPSTGKFTATGSMNTPRWGAAASLLPDGDVLIAGGEDDLDVSISGGARTILSSAELFDPSTGVFTPVPGSMITPRVGAVAAPLPDGDVLIAGGNIPLSSAELYVPSTYAFTATASMTTPREQAVAAPLPDGDVLIAGGNSTSGYLSSAEVYGSAPVPSLPPRAAMKGGQFGAGTVGLPTGIRAVVVTNVAPLSFLRITGARLSGPDARDFKIRADLCAGQALTFQQSCTITVQAIPHAFRAYSAVLQLHDNERAPSTVRLSVNGGPSRLLPNPTGGRLSAISCPTTDVCWGIGGSATGAAIERWDGSAWKTQRTLRHDSLAAVSCATASVCTAIGNYGIDRWAGAQWSTQHQAQPYSLGQPYSPNSISCPTVKMCAVTNSYTGWPLVQTYNGKRSSTTPGKSVPGAHFGAVSCASATFCIAVGETYGGSPLFMGWNGRSWSTVTLPPLPSNVPTLPSGAPEPDAHELGVSCPTVTFCVAVGVMNVETPFDPSSQFNWGNAIELWNGRTWTLTVDPPAPGTYLTTVSCRPTHVCTALGVAHGNQVQMYHGYGSTWSAQTITMFAGPEPGEALTCPSQHVCFGLIWHAYTNNEDVLRLNF